MSVSTTLAFLGCVSFRTGIRTGRAQSGQTECTRKNKTFPLSRERNNACLAVDLDVRKAFELVNTPRIQQSTCRECLCRR